ncbi:MAG: CBS domain-containing protein [Candidatus Dadabacteria bacterium]|nr:MAG: CBS domain-containing protein [Candidatus Dadabacteria bacterium]
MDEKDAEVAEFIDETLRSLEEGQEERKDQILSEERLRAPVSVLDPREPLAVEPQTSVLEAVTLMQREHVGCVLVTRGDKLKGIFTERDVLTQIVGQGVDPAKTPVRRVMTPDPETLRPTDSIAYALNKMSLGDYRHIPLVDKAGKAVGIISVKDIVNYIVSFFPKSVLNLPTLPRQNYATEREGP